MCVCVCVSGSDKGVSGWRAICREGFGIDTGKKSFGFRGRDCGGSGEEGGEEVRYWGVAGAVRGWLREDGNSEYRKGTQTILNMESESAGADIDLKLL